MARIVLGVTGSVAAIYTPELTDRIRTAGHEVLVVATKPSLYFFDPEKLKSLSPPEGWKTGLVTDDLEWPGEAYQRGAAVLHIELRRWAELLIIAPLDANTLAKFASGLCDNCLTCLYRAWDRRRPVILAPAMNTFMWEHPATVRNLRQIADDLQPPGSPETKDDFGSIPGASRPQSADRPPPSVPTDVGLELLDSINSRRGPLTIVPPQAKKLACDEFGLGAMADRSNLLAAIQSQLARPKTGIP